VRSKPQRNSYHRFTVDRHLVEAAAAAAGLTRRVPDRTCCCSARCCTTSARGCRATTRSRHGRGRRAGPRLGLPPEDVDVLVRLVEHHLLLPDVATRRDLHDPATARAVADAVGSAEVLELLHALTEADSAATGPAAWSSWKAGLVQDLVRRTGALLAGARSRARPRSPTGRPRSSRPAPTRCRRAATR
jgi:[protein-PII] uridylyltransferase